MQRNNHKPLALLIILAIGISAGFAAARLADDPDASVTMMPQVTAEHFPELTNDGVDGKKPVQTCLFTYVTEEGPRVAVAPQQDLDIPNVSVPYPDRLFRK